MNKFNRQFNAACFRVGFWQDLTAKFADFDPLVKQRFFLTPDDILTLKNIHKALWECYSAAKEKSRVHHQTLNNLKEAFLHERTIIN